MEDETCKLNKGNGLEGKKIVILFGHKITLLKICTKSILAKFSKTIFVSPFEI